MTAERQADQRAIADAVEIIREVSRIVIGRLDPDLQFRAYRAAVRALQSLTDSDRPGDGTTIVRVSERVKRNPEDDR